MDRRELLKQACALGVAAPFIMPGRALADTDDAMILASVHPDLREIARRILPFGRAPLNITTLAQQRKGAEAYGPKPSADVPYERRVIPGSKGQPDVAIYLINAAAGAARPAILFTHGGGFVTGTALSSVASLQTLCKELECVAVSVDYRLAPETTFAGSIEDNYAGLKWLHTNAAQLGVDNRRIAVMGESAGGGHAALLAITARDRGEVPLCFQCLIYPMLDDRTGVSRQMPSHVGNIVWTAEKNRFGWESFLGVKPGGRSVPGGVPARVSNLAGLPPAWIGVGSIDLFVDEDVDYAQRLNNAGVPTELIVVPGAFHGFDSPFFPAKISRWFNSAKLDALRRGFGIPG
ncbi:alpha/beta hydrolase [Novosphingobium sp. G106]|uniref:alpha/beta hydrolase n=1 Tax=Novosphingobium sp. G106 TaxID=2849500 RepID=UPI001C2DE7A0|nr:alpha/beta hydrolase [Novosphingobium sp. G106]MBV1691425.1 alpha/beta hydrolase [Novosphingobium sp. G106]